MHKLNPKDLPELKIVDLTVARAVVIFASVTLFFVLPVLGITYLQTHLVNLTAQENTTSAQTTQPQVAGVSTDASTENANVLGIDMGSEQGLLLTIGIILVGISLIIVLFLIAENTKKRD